MKGFTFVELLIVIAIVVVLGTIGLAAMSRAMMQARDAKRSGIMNDVRQALGRYNLANFSYPNSPNDFCGTVFPLVQGNYLPEMPADPKTKQPLCNLPTDGNPFLGNITYIYTATPSSGTAASYVLTLIKETGDPQTGGNRADFYSPQ